MRSKLFLMTMLLAVLLAQTAYGAEYAKVVMHGVENPALVAEAVKKVKEATSLEILPTSASDLMPNFAAFETGRGHGNMWVIGAKDVVYCQNRDSMSVAELEEQLASAKNLIIELDTEAADMLLTSLEPELPCLGEAVESKLIHSWFMLQGISAFLNAPGSEKDKRSAAHEFFVRAHRALPNEPWDADFNTQVESAYLEAEVDVLKSSDKEYAAELQVLGEVQNLTVNGGEVPQELLPGYYLLQWTVNDEVFGRVVHVNHTVGSVVRLVSLDAFISVLRVDPHTEPYREVVLDEWNNYAGRRGIIEYGIVSFEGAEPIGLMYVLGDLHPAVVDLSDLTPENIGGGNGEPMTVDSDFRAAIGVGGLYQAYSMTHYGGFHIAGELLPYQGFGITLGGSGTFTKDADGNPWGLMTLSLGVRWTFQTNVPVEPFAGAEAWLDMSAGKPVGAVVATGGLELKFPGDRMRAQLMLAAGGGGQAELTNGGRLRATLGVTFRSPRQE